MREWNNRLFLKSSVLIFCIAYTVLIISCADSPQVIERDVVPQPQNPEATEIVEPEPPVNRVTFCAVGDNLIHIEIINDARTENGGFDFSPVYTYIKPQIENADIAFINMETISAGTEFGISGYPKFNAPVELGEAVFDVGFNIVNYATNHSLDKGEAALRKTLAFWESKNIIALGAFTDEKKRSTPVRMKINNITFGFLSYTYGTNDLPLPDDSPYLVALIDTNVMQREIAALRPLCDYLVVSMHWGEEFRASPNEFQEKLAQFLAEQKVDLVLGHHPHVLEEVRMIKRPDNGYMLCFFSLGNFISAQKVSDTMLGGMARVIIEKNGETTQTVSYELIPLVTHYDKHDKDFRVIPLVDYTEELAARHGLGPLNIPELYNSFTLIKEGNQ
jgi:poly-gamma-glutamate synthesis protein (capsule biosynthesis protein)